MGELTGGDLLAEALTAAGVDLIFGLPGVQLDSAFDAIARRSGDFRVIHTRHEQAASYMADGYARASGRIGCCMVVPGPGLLNAMAGLATAYACSSPVLCITGQVRSDSIGAGLGLLHEIPNQLEMVRSVAKWSGRATRAEQIPGLVAEAVSRMLDGPPRPVVIEVPPDVLEAPATSGTPSTAAAAGGQAPDLDALERSAALLERADRPLIVSGGGVLQSGAWDELRSVAERLGAPVLMTSNGKGAISSRHPLAFDGIVASRLVKTADVILAVGTRFAAAQGARWRLEPGQSLIRIDADPLEMARGVQPAVTVVADARGALEPLAELLRARSHPSAWQGLDELRREASAKIASIEPQAALAMAIREEIDDADIVINGMTQVGYWSRLGFPVYEPRTFITAGYQGTLGFELPTGLGAQVARPDRRVIVTVGDGGFMFNVQELATAAQHRINAIAVVFNDGAYGNVRRTQRQRFEGRLIASELQNPDFLKLADAFGVEGRRAEGAGGLRSALREALGVQRPFLIEVPVGEMPSPWGMILGGG